MNDDFLQYLNESPTVFFQCRNENGWPVEFVTKNILENFGYECEDFLSSRLSFLDLVYEEDKKQILEEVEYISNTKLDKYEFKPYRIISKNNKISWVQDITKIIRDENQNPILYFCYITDITNQINLHEKLIQSENIISTIYNNSFQFIGLMTPDGTLIRANKTSLDFANIKEEDVIGKKFWDCPWWRHSIEDQNILKDDIKRASKGESIKAKKIHYDDKGNKIYVDFSIKPVFNQENEVIYLIPEGHNITDNVLKEKRLSKYMKIIDENVLISTTDTKGTIIKSSTKFSKLSEFSKNELIGSNHNIMRHPDNKNSRYKALWETISKGKIWKGEHKNLTKSGEVFWVENIITPNFDDNNKIISYTSIYNDITAKKEIEELLITDVLTNIYNRRYFNSIFDSELRRSRRNYYSFVLMILDIDYFKQYNDIYGHHEGDTALVVVANSLKSILYRAEDYVFRLGGEEFAVITTDVTKEGAIKIANKLKQSIEELEIEHKGSDVSNYLTISIGIKYLSSNFSLDANEIYKRADKALYKVKENGRNSVFID